VTYRVGHVGSTIVYAKTSTNREDDQRLGTMDSYDAALLVVRALNACEEIRMLHRRDDEDRCQICDICWPCPTAAALARGNMYV
jgi:hypothetical protein